MLIRNRICHIYGDTGTEYLLLQMVDEHDLAGMEREVEAIRRQTAQPFLLAAVQVEDWNDDLSPWPAPPIWGKQGFGGRAGDTLAWLAQAVPSIRRQYSIKEDCKVILGGYSLAGLLLCGRQHKRTRCMAWRRLRRPCGFPVGQNTKRRTLSKRSVFTSALVTARNIPKIRLWRRWAITSAPCTPP